MDLSTLRKHPLTVAFCAAAIFIVGTVPMWLATIWPLFVKNKTLPEWWSEHGLPMNAFSSAYGWVNAGIGIMLLVLFLMIWASKRRSEIPVVQEIPHATLSKQSVARLAATIDKRLVEVKTGVSQGLSFQDLADRFSDFVTTGRAIVVPVVHGVEPAVIEECDAASHSMQWDEFRKLASNLKDLNNSISDFNSSPNLEKAKRLLSDSMQTIPEMTREIREQMQVRFQ